MHYCFKCFSILWRLILFGCACRFHFGPHHLYYNNHAISPGTMKQSWGIWVNQLVNKYGSINHTNPQYNQLVYKPYRKHNLSRRTSRFHVYTGACNPHILYSATTNHLCPIAAWVSYHLLNQNMDDALLIYTYIWVICSGIDLSPVWGIAVS